MKELKKLRFAVADGERLRSTIWFISGNRQGCLYFGSRSLGGSLKVSLHKDGNSHVRFGGNHGLGEIVGQYAGRWKRRLTPAKGAAHAASIFFPTDYLRHVRPVPDDVRPLFAIRPAEAGKAIELGIFYHRETPKAVEARLARIGLPLWNVALATGEFVSGVARMIAFDPASLPPLETWGRSIKYVSPEAKQIDRMSGLSAMAWNDPSEQGYLQVIEITGLRIERATKNAQLSR